MLVLLFPSIQVSGNTTRVYSCDNVVDDWEMRIVVVEVRTVVEES